MLQVCDAHRRRRSAFGPVSTSMADRAVTARDTVPGVSEIHFTRETGRSPAVESCGCAIAAANSLTRWSASALRGVPSTFASNSCRMAARSCLVLSRSASPAPSGEWGLLYPPEEFVALGVLDQIPRRIEGHLDRVREIDGQGFSGDDQSGVASGFLDRRGVHRPILPHANGEVEFSA